MGFFDIFCVPCGSQSKKRGIRYNLQELREKYSRRLDYQISKIKFQSCKNVDIFSALCIGGKASCKTVIVKRIKMPEPITNVKIAKCIELVELIDRAKSLEHINLVKYLDASFDIENRYFEIITEQFPISLLDSYKMDEQQTKVYIEEIINAIKFLHDNGINYINIKQNNVLFDQYTNLKLRDYIGNHIIEFLVSDRETFFNNSTIAMDIEDDITCLMGMVRNIGLTMVRFIDETNFTNFVFYLESIKQWDFKKIKSHNFFQSNMEKSGVHNPVADAFIKSKTLVTKKMSDKPIMFNSVYKKKESKKRENSNDKEDVIKKNSNMLLKNDRNFDEVLAYLKNIEESKKKKKEQTEDKEEMKKLRNKRLALEDAFGDSDDESEINESLKHNRTHKKLIQTIPSQHSETPKKLRSIDKRKINVDLHERMKQIEANFDSSDNSTIKENQSKINIINYSDISINQKKLYENSFQNKPLPVNNIEKSFDVSIYNSNKPESRFPDNKPDFKKKKSVNKQYIANGYNNQQKQMRDGSEFEQSRKLSKISVQKLDDNKNSTESQTEIKNVINMLNVSKNKPKHRRTPSNKNNILLEDHKDMYMKKKVKPEKLDFGRFNEQNS